MPSIDEDSDDGGFPNLEPRRTKMAYSYDAHKDAIGKRIQRFENGGEVEGGSGIRNGPSHTDIPVTTVPQGTNVSQDLYNKIHPTNQFRPRRDDETIDSYLEKARAAGKEPQ